MSIIENLLDDAGVNPDDVADEDTRNAGNQTVGRDHEIDPNEVGGPAIPEPAQEVPVGSATEYSEAQFDALTDIQFDEIMRVIVVSEDTDGPTKVGARVTDHHESFTETPTTANPRTDPSEYSGSLGELDFENGAASFTVSGFGEDVDTDLVTFAFGSGLLNTNNIETIGVIIGGTDPADPNTKLPDHLFVESVEAEPMSATTATTATTESTDSSGAEERGDPPYEQERDELPFKRVEHQPNE